MLCLGIRPLSWQSERQAVKGGTIHERTAIGWGDRETQNKHCRAAAVAIAAFFRYPSEFQNAEAVGSRKGVRADTATSLGWQQALNSEPARGVSKRGFILPSCLDSPEVIRSED